MFGTAGLTIRSQAAQGRIVAEVTVPQRCPPSEVWLRLRHPEGLIPQRVLMGGSELEPERLRGEDIRLMPGARGGSGPLSVIAEYR